MYEKENRYRKDQHKGADEKPEIKMEIAGDPVKSASHSPALSNLSFMLGSILVGLYSLPASRRPQLTTLGAPASRRQGVLALPICCRRDVGAPRSCGLAFNAGSYKT